MADFSRFEIEAAHDRYLRTRHAIEAGELPWAALADFFTEDATFIDPAWGRMHGRPAIADFMNRSMSGLEDWRFPHGWRVIEGNRLVASWKNRLPGARADGSFYEAQGLSVMIYAGNGLFSYEEDMLNMVHVFELVGDSGWTPGPTVNMPPPRPPR